MGIPKNPPECLDTMWKLVSTKGYESRLVGVAEGVKSATLARGFVAYSTPGLGQLFLDMSPATRSPSAIKLSFRAPHQPTTRR